MKITNRFFTSLCVIPFALSGCTFKGDLTQSDFASYSYTKWRCESNGLSIYVEGKSNINCIGIGFFDETDDPYYTDLCAPAWVGSYIRMRNVMTGEGWSYTTKKVFHNGKWNGQIRAYNDDSDIILFPIPLLESELDLQYFKFTDFITLDESIFFEHVSESGFPREGLSWTYENDQNTVELKFDKGRTFIMRSNKLISKGTYVPTFEYATLYFEQDEIFSNTEQLTLYYE